MLISIFYFVLQTKSIMATAIPLIADAVAGIIKNSTNGSFKESCRDLMKVYDLRTNFQSFLSLLTSVLVITT